MSSRCSRRLRPQSMSSGIANGHLGCWPSALCFSSSMCSSDASQGPEAGFFPSALRPRTARICNPCASNPCKVLGVMLIADGSWNRGDALLDSCVFFARGVRIHLMTTRGLTFDSRFLCPFQTGGGSLTLIAPAGGSRRLPRVTHRHAPRVHAHRLSPAGQRVRSAACRRACSPPQWQPSTLA